MTGELEKLEDFFADKSIDGRVADRIKAYYQERLGQRPAPILLICNFLYENDLLDEESVNAIILHRVDKDWENFEALLIKGGGLEKAFGLSCNVSRLVRVFVSLR